MPDVSWSKGVGLLPKVVIDKRSRTLCEYTVTTLDFDSTNGNRRTQAAGAINQHGAGSHLRQRALVSAKSCSRVAL
jgi:hypothetical protein